MAYLVRSMQTGGELAKRCGADDRQRREYLDEGVSTGT